MQARSLFVARLYMHYAIYKINCPNISVLPMSLLRLDLVLRLSPEMFRSSDDLRNYSGHLATNLEARRKMSLQSHLTPTTLLPLQWYAGVARSATIGETSQSARKGLQANFGACSQRNS